MDSKRKCALILLDKLLPYVFLETCEVFWEYAPGASHLFKFCYAKMEHLIVMINSNMRALHPVSFVLALCVPGKTLDPLFLNSSPMV